MPKKAVLNTVTADAAGASATARRDAAAPGHVIAIATDASMLELLRGAVKDRHRLWRAEDVAQAAELLLAAPASVLLLDVAVTRDETARVVERLRQQFPGLPVIVSGRRDDESALSAMISSGAIFRFLHKPLSEERARNFIEAAARRLAEQPPPPPKVVASPETASREAAEPQPEPQARHARSGRGRAAAVASVLLLAAAAAALVHFAPWEDSRTRPSPAVDAGTPAAMPAPTADPRIESLMRAGDAAIEEGRYAEPSGDNAIEWYRAVLALDPAHEAALAGLTRAADLLLVEAEFALLDGNPAGAATALDAARAASPGHPRLADVSAQLAAERARLVAPNVPAAAPVRAPPPEQDAGEPVRGEAARRASFDRAMTSAREAIAQGQPAQAESWLARAAELSVDPPAVQRLQAQLGAVRAATEREERARLLALANQRLAQGRLVEPAADSARHYLDLLEAADPAFEGLAETRALLAERMLAQTQQPPAAALPQAAGRTAPARVAYVPPDYPPRAAARGIEGWVDVEFMVGADGQPRSARVVNASPRGVFDSAALDAVAKWRYEAPTAGEQRVALRVRFELAPR